MVAWLGAPRCGLGPGSACESGDTVGALDLDGLDDDVLGRAIPAVRRHGAYPVHDVGALDDLAEDGVLTSQPGCGHRCDEELGAVGARPGVGHGQQVRPVEREVRMEFVAELVTRTAGPGAERVPGLDHEVGDDPVEDRSVVEPSAAGLPGTRVRPLALALG